MTKGTEMPGRESPTEILSKEAMDAFLKDTRVLARSPDQHAGEAEDDFMAAMAAIEKPPCTSPCVPCGARS